MVWGIVEDIIGEAQDITGTLLPIGSLTGSSGEQAADQAFQAQQQATEAAIAEARAQREEETRRWEQQLAEYQRRQGLAEQQYGQQFGLLAPYITGGQGALYEMLALSGLAPQANMTTGDNMPRSIQPVNPAQYVNQPSTGTGTGGILKPMGQSRLLIDNAIGDPGKMISPEQLDEAIRQTQPVTGQPITAPGMTQIPELSTVASPYAGMSGDDAQAAAIAQISQSPLLAELTRQGEEALLQQASATGGLRGGNIQGALAQYRPHMLQSEIENQYARLGQLAGIGQQSVLGAPTTAQLGIPAALAADPSVVNLQQQLGAQQAGSILSGAQMQQQGIGNLLDLGGTFLGALF